MVRPVSGSGCGPIPAFLFVAFRAIVPYLAVAFTSVVLPPSCYAVVSQVLTTPVLVCLGAYGLPIKEPLHGIHLL